MMRCQNTKCFNCGRIGHLTRGCRQGVPRNNVSFGNDPNRGPKLLDYAEDVAKADTGTMNVDQKEANKVTHYYWETP